MSLVFGDDRIVSSSFVGKWLEHVECCMLPFLPPFLACDRILCRLLVGLRPDAGCYAAPKHLAQNDSRLYLTAHGLKQQR